MTYHINQSPLYKIRSHNKLAKIIGLSGVKKIRTILSKGNKNYYISTLASGRIIEVPKGTLWRVHSRINNLLTRITPPDYLNSGVKGRSNVKNALDHINQKEVIKIDIKKYYQSITLKQVEGFFIHTMHCSNDVSRTLASLCCINNHIPTGSKISQSLSFFVNKSVFDYINRYSKSRDVIFTCYVDDLTFSSNHFDKGFKNHIISYIRKKRSYNCHKIKHYKEKSKKPITGVLINKDKLMVMNKHRKSINDLRSQESHIMANGTDTDKEKFFQQIQGHLFSAGQINYGYRKEGFLYLKKMRENAFLPTNQYTK